MAPSCLSATATAACGDKAATPLVRSRGGFDPKRTSSAQPTLPLCLQTTSSVSLNRYDALIRMRGRHETAGVHQFCERRSFPSPGAARRARPARRFLKTHNHRLWQIHDSLFGKNAVSVSQTRWIIIGERARRASVQMLGILSRYELPSSGCRSSIVTGQLLANDAALVTGATSGIGAAIVRALAREGARTFLT